MRAGWNEKDPNPRFRRHSHLQQKNRVACETSRSRSLNHPLYRFHQPLLLLNLCFVTDRTLNNTTDSRSTGEYEEFALHLALSHGTV